MHLECDLLSSGAMIPATRLLIPSDLDGEVFRTTAIWTSSHAHRHKELELNLLIRGSAECVLDDRKYVFRMGAIAWLFGAQSHLMINQSKDYESWVAVFRPRLVSRLCIKENTRILRGLSPTGHHCKILPLESFQHLDRICQIVNASRSDPIRHNAGLGHLLLESWHVYQQCDRVPAGTTLHLAVERLIQLMKGDGVDLNFAALARAAGLSPSRLGRLFKAQTGLTVVEHRNRLRIQRFIELYGAGERVTMLAAALQAGFGSYTQFHRVFSRAFGYNPRQKFAASAGRDN